MAVDTEQLIIYLVRSGDVDYPSPYWQAIQPWKPRYLCAWDKLHDEGATRALASLNGDICGH